MSMLKFLDVYQAKRKSVELPLVLCGTKQFDDQTMVAEFFDSQKETMLLLYHYASKFPVKLVTNYTGNGGTNQKYQWKVCNGFLVIKNRNHNDI